MRFSKIIILIFLFCFLFSKQMVYAQFSFTTGTAQTTSSGSKSVRLLNDVTTVAELSKYGGWKNAKKTATGFFRTEKVNNVWYMIDPEGYLFFMIGVNSISKGGGQVLPDNLRNIGCNTMGCWSDESINTSATQKMAYCPRWNILQTYKNTSTRTKDFYNAGIIPIFDPQFATSADNQCKALAAAKNDPYLLGHFSDNELPIYDNTTYGNLLDRFLAITTKTDPNYLAANNWMIARKGAGYTITSTDREEFHGYVCGTYYKIVSEAIKRYDPNHLYLGSRLHGSALSKPSIYIEAGKYVDMISINCYGTWTPSKTTMDMWSAGGKPFFISEFYAMADDAGLPNSAGAGWIVPTQNDRAKFFENFTLALIEHSGCIGFHYFRYNDDDVSNKGLLDGLMNNWYLPMKNSFNKIAKDVYGLRAFMLGNNPTGMIEHFTPEIFLYPNPTNDEFSLILPVSDKKTRLQIVNLEGKIILDESNQTNHQIYSLKSSPAGIYFARIFNADFSKTIKLVKN